MVGDFYSLTKASLRRQSMDYEGRLECLFVAIAQSFPRRVLTQQTLLGWSPT